MEGLEKDTRKIKYFLMKTLRTVHATTCRTFSIKLLTFIIIEVSQKARMFVTVSHF
jgi:hypothetical protein